MTPWRAALSLALAAFVLWRNLPGALLCLFPRLARARTEDESWPRVDRKLFDRMEEELQPLGFHRLGVHVERMPLKRGRVAYDFLHPGEHTWATGYAQREEARLVLLTPFDGGAFVLTADHRFPNVDRPGACLAGGIPNADPAQLLAAHRRRIERLEQAGRRRQADLSLDARVRAANDWFAGFGARLTRARHLNGLFLTLTALVIVGAVCWALVRFG